MALSLAGCDPRLRGGTLCVKVRRDGRIVSVAVIVAVGANEDGRRESSAWRSARRIAGRNPGLRRGKLFWADFLRKLARRVSAGAKIPH